MVAMMAALMVDEWIVWKDCAIVEPTTVTMVDDLDAKMAALLADELEQKSAALMIEMMAALMVDEWVDSKDCANLEPTAVMLVDNLDAKIAA